MISKLVMIIIFVEFIDQLIDYPINRASLCDGPDQHMYLHKFSLGRPLFRMVFVLKKANRKSQKSPCIKWQKTYQVDWVPKLLNQYKL